MCEAPSTRRVRYMAVSHEPASSKVVKTRAERAQDGDGLLLLTHSEIRPPGYASTSEVADHLIDFLGGASAPRQRGQAA